MEDVNTGKPRKVTNINWNKVNLTHFDTLRCKFSNSHFGTLAEIYNQKYRDIWRNFKTFHKLGKGKPKFESCTGRLSFRILVNAHKQIDFTRASTEKNHGTKFDFELFNVHAKTHGKLSHNKGWVYIPGCSDGNEASTDSIKCFCPCDIEYKDISSVTISRDTDGKYYISCVLRCGRVYISKKNALDALGEPKKAGIDVNLSPKTRVVAASPYFNEEPLEYVNHTEVKPARLPYKEYNSKLSREQRKLSRKVRFSKRWYKQKYKLAKVHNKIANIRLDWNRKTASYLTTHYNALCIEDLKVSQMKEGQPKWMQKLYNDANLYQLRQCIRWSCLKSGRELYYVSPEHTSKTCHNCWHTNHDLKLGQRRWCCPNCGSILNRDENAARNIYALAFSYEDVEGELRTNRIYIDSFEERKPVEDEKFIESLVIRCGGEEVQTV